MDKIKKLRVSTVYDDIEFAAKINEIIDAVNELIKRTQGSAYVGPGPSPYDLNAMGDYLKRGKK